MPLVPTYEPGQVGDPDIRPQYQRHVGSTGFGTEIAEGLGDVARGLAGEVDRQAQVMDDMDEAAAKELDVSYADFTRDLLHNPETGFFAKKGKGALEARADIEEQLRKRAEDMKAQAQSQQQREMFGMVADRRLGQALDSVSSYSQAQVGVYKQASTAARAATFAEEAATVYGDSQAQQVALTAGLAEVEELNRLEGGDADTLALKRLEYTSGVHSQVIAQLIDANPAEAKRYLDANGDQMTVKARAIAKSNVSEQGAAVAALDMADKLWADAEGDYGQYMALTSGIADPNLRMKVEQRGETLRTRADHARKDDQADLWAGVTEKLVNGANLEELPAAERQALIQADLYDKAITFQNAIRNGEGPKSGGPTYMALHQMAAKDPAAFRAFPIDQVAQLVTGSEFVELTKLQTTQNKSWANELQPQVNAVMAELKPQLRVMRPDLNDDEWQALVAQAEAFALAAVRDKHQKGVELNDAQRAQIVKAGLTPTGGGKRPKLFLESEAGAVYRNDVGQYVAIRNALASAYGRPARFEEITEAAENAAKGKPIVRASSIPSAMKQQLTTAFQKRHKRAPSADDLEALYTDYILDRPPSR